MKEKIWYYRTGIKIVAALATLCLFVTGTLLVSAAALSVR